MKANFLKPRTKEMSVQKRIAHLYHSFRIQHCPRSSKAFKNDSFYSVNFVLSLSTDLYALASPDTASFLVFSGVDSYMFRVMIIISCCQVINFICENMVRIYDFFSFEAEYSLTQAKLYLRRYNFLVFNRKSDLLICYLFH